MNNFKAKQYTITNRVKLNLLPKTFTYEIDGIEYTSQWKNEFKADERNMMIESSLEEIALEFGEHSTEDEHEEFLLSLNQLHNQLLPDSPIE